ncbi:UNKNOWN [Stylonychia lemnae]|uniref:Uncharacterized protein n=1 Tax=Stylonychia lemnae TaxID=5949 RepID=A0A078B7F7_STYLE|nr:UNKNOWN [Stylonychia lemnae]|eukprot:CDW90151.1 UNKNOWN [Stylonychia lemnae]
MGCNSSKQSIYLVSDGKKVKVDKWASPDIKFEKSQTISSVISSQLEEKRISQLKSLRKSQFQNTENWLPPIDEEENKVDSKEVALKERKTKVVINEDHLAKNATQKQSRKVMQDSIIGNKLQQQSKERARINDKKKSMELIKSSNRKKSKDKVVQEQVKSKNRSPKRGADEQATFIIKKTKIVYKGDLDNFSSRQLPFNRRVKQKSSNLSVLKKTFDLSKEQDYIQSNFMQFTTLNSSFVMNNSFMKKQSFLEKSDFEDSQNTQIHNATEALPIIQEQQVFQSVTQQKRPSNVIDRRRISSAKQEKRVSNVSKKQTLVLESQNSQKELNNSSNLSIKRTSRSLSLNQRINSGGDEKTQTNNDKPYELPQINILVIENPNHHENEVDGVRQSRHNLSNHLRVSQNSMNSQYYYQKINKQQVYLNDISSSLHPMRQSNFSSNKTEQIRIPIPQGSVYKQRPKRGVDRAFSERNSPRDELVRISKSINMTLNELNRSMANSINLGQLQHKIEKEIRRQKEKGNRFNIRVAPSVDLTPTPTYNIIQNQPENFQLTEQQTSSHKKTFSFGTNFFDQDNNNNANMAYLMQPGGNQHYSMQHFQIPQINQSQLLEEDDSPKSKYSDGRKVEETEASYLKPSQYLEKLTQSQIIKQSQERTHFLRQSYSNLNSDQARPLSSNNLLPVSQFNYEILRKSMNKKDSEQFSPNFKLSLSEMINMSPNENPYPQPKNNDHLRKTTQMSILRHPHHSDVKVNVFHNTPGEKPERSFIFDSMMLLSNEKPNNYTQYSGYSGSRKGSDLKSNQSNRESKQADYNSNVDDENMMGLDDNQLNLMTESEGNSSSQDEIYETQEPNLLLESIIKAKAQKKNTTYANGQQNFQGSSASVVYNVKGSSSDVLQNPSSVLSGLVSRRTTSQNRQVQFKNSDRTVSKNSSANLVKFLNRIMQLENEDDEDEDEDFANGSSSAIPNQQYVPQNLSSNPQNLDSAIYPIDSSQLRNQYSRRKSKKTSKIKATRYRHSVNFVEYKFPEET